MESVLRKPVHFNLSILDTTCKCPVFITILIGFREAIELRDSYDPFYRDSLIFTILKVHFQIFSLFTESISVKPVSAIECLKFTDRDSLNSKHQIATAAEVRTATYAKAAQV